MRALTPSTEMTKKLALIAVMTLLLIFPLSQVEEQLDERKTYQFAAQQEIAKGWGDSVRISSVRILKGQAEILSRSAQVQVAALSQVKKRGIFRAPVYSARWTGTYAFTDAAGEALSIPIAPIAAIQGFKIVDVASGKEIAGLLRDGGIVAKLDKGAGREFRVEVDLRGSQSLSYSASSSDQETVRMEGDWKRPKFSENELPQTSKLTSQGFSADWSLRALPREDGRRVERQIEVRHLEEGSDYRSVERILKYGILLIALTFVLLFVVEVIARSPIHWIQYGLIGCALALFYLLLLALSEVVGFGWAYGIASLSVISLIAVYVLGFIRSKKFVGTIVGEQCMLSGFFYVLLSLEESAFLLGAIGLFVALAALMIVTRRMDWARPNTSEVKV
jgi:inner membrane protein